MTRSGRENKRKHQPFIQCVVTRVFTEATVPLHNELIAAQLLSSPILPRFAECSRTDPAPTASRMIQPSVSGGSFMLLPSGVSRRSKALEGADDFLDGGSVQAFWAAEDVDAPAEVYIA